MNFLLLPSEVLCEILSQISSAETLSCVMRTCKTLFALVDNNLKRKFVLNLFGDQLARFDDPFSFFRTSHAMLKSVDRSLANTYCKKEKEHNRVCFVIWKFDPGLIDMTSRIRHFYAHLNKLTSAQVSKMVKKKPLEHAFNPVHWDEISGSRGKYILRKFLQSLEFPDYAEKVLNMHPEFEERMYAGDCGMLVLSKFGMIYFASCFVREWVEM